MGGLTRRGDRAAVVAAVGPASPTPTAAALARPGQHGLCGSAIYQVADTSHTTSRRTHGRYGCVRIGMYVPECLLLF